MWASTSNHVIVREARIYMVPIVRESKISVFLVEVVSLIVQHFVRAVIMD